MSTGSTGSTRVQMAADRMGSSHVKDLTRGRPTRDKNPRMNRGAKNTVTGTVKS